MGLELYDVCCSWTFWSVLNVEADSLAFSQSLEASAANAGVMDEKVVTVFAGDEPKTLRLIKPLNRSFCHSQNTSFH